MRITVVMLLLHLNFVFSKFRGARNYHYKDTKSSAHYNMASENIQNS